MADIPPPGRVVPPSPDTGFLSAPHGSAAVQHLYDEDVDEVGYVMNQTRLWAHQPALQQGCSL